MMAYPKNTKIQRYGLCMNPMVIIQLPASAVRAENIRRTAHVLDAIVPEDMHKSIQLFQTTLDEPFEARAKKIIQNAKKIPKSFLTTLHAPFCSHNPLPEYDLSRQEGRVMLEKTCKLAEEIGCHSIVAHFNTIRYHPSTGKTTAWDKRWLDEQTLFEDLVSPLFENIHTLSEKTECILSFENMPIPLHGNMTTHPEETLCDPCMASFEFLERFAKEFKNKSNVKICLDTSHYGLASGILNRELARQDFRTGDSLIAAGLYPMYPLAIQKQPPLSKAIQRLLEIGALGEVQLADYGAIWEPSHKGKKGRLLEEGKGFLEGEGKVEILDAAMLVADDTNGIPLAFDVEVKDYAAMTEQIAAVLLFLDYLKDQDDMKRRAKENITALVQEYKRKAESV